MRRLAVLVIGAAVAAGVTAPAGAAPASPGEYPGVRNILPPGQSGSVNAAEAALVAAGDPEAAARSTARTPRRISRTSSRCTTRSTTPTSAP